MSKIKSLIRKMEASKASFDKLVILGAIQEELDNLKKVLSKKIK